MIEPAGRTVSSPTALTGDRPLRARDLRRANRSALLRRLYFDGPLSRQELITSVGLSAASVSKLIADLVAENLVVEAGSVGSDGGRPRILLRVNQAAFAVVGVDVGETRVRVELFDLGLTERARAEFPVEPGSCDPATIVDRIRAGLHMVIGSSGIDPEHILGIGVGVPGMVRREPPAVVDAQTLGWAAVPLQEMLAEVTGLPLFIDNGATTMGQAEMWLGAGRGAGSTAIVLIGSGVGAAIVVNGSAYRGVSSSAGEWGHTTVAVAGRRCRCGALGCLEAYIGAAAIVDRYAESLREEIPLSEDQEIALGQILDSANSAHDDETAQQARIVLDHTATYLGIGIANLINLLNPERVILGGWAGLMLGHRMLGTIKEVAARNALRYPFGQTRIDLCQLGAHAVARGAATLPVAEFLARGGRLPRGTGLGTTRELSS
ncbi:MAG TPA: ROK family protein [Pseudonocardiaceae bacterium]|jgi:predicted NBD/HSP70 family sugar kinase|nr:ROK family protein [Pseudonocardiaceae bacterium]